MKKVDNVPFTTKTPADLIWPVITADALLKAKKFNPEAKPGLIAFFDADSAELKALMAAAAKLGKEAFGLTKVSVAEMTDTTAKTRFPFVSGDMLLEKALEKGKDYSRLAGKIGLRAAIYNNQWPSVGDGRKGNALADPSIVYNGCHGLVLVDLFAYDKKSKGIAAGLLSISFLPGGERWGSGPGAVDPAAAFGGTSGQSTTEDPTDDEIPC